MTRAAFMRRVTPSNAYASPPVAVEGLAIENRRIIAAAVATERFPPWRLDTEAATAIG